MQHLPHVGFVDPHAEGARRHDHMHLIREERP